MRVWDFRRLRRVVGLAIRRSSFGASERANKYCKISRMRSGLLIDSMMQRRYVKTATDEPPSISDDSTSDGYLIFRERT